MNVTFVLSTGLRCLADVAHLVIKQNASRLIDQDVVFITIKTVGVF